MMKFQISDWRCEVSASRRCVCSERTSDASVEGGSERSERVRRANPGVQESGRKAVRIIGASSRRWGDQNGWYQAPELRRPKPCSFHTTGGHGENTEGRPRTENQTLRGAPPETQALEAGVRANATARPARKIVRQVTVPLSYRRFGIPPSFPGRVFAGAGSSDCSCRRKSRRRGAGQGREGERERDREIER